LIMKRKNKIVVKNYFGKRLTYYYGIAFLIVFLVIGFFLKQAVEARLFREVQESLFEQAQLLAHTLPDGLVNNPERSEIYQNIRTLSEDRKARITIVSLAGTVLADSKRSWEELLKMESHADRPEIQRALKQEIGVSSRYSKTLGKKMLYVAVPMIRKGVVLGVVRLSLPTDEILIFLSEVKYPIWVGASLGILVMFLLSIFLGGKITQRVVDIAYVAKKFSKGDLDQKIEIKGDDEFDSLATSLNQMAIVLKKRIVEREIEKEKSSVILSNMSEGVIALNAQKEILLINDSIENFFNISRSRVMGKTLIHVTKSPAIDQLASRVIKEKIRLHEKMEIYKNGSMTLNVDLFGLERDDISAILVFSDITQIISAEKMRREFVANVSHELRTPLTSIRGFIETLLQGAFSDEEASKRFLNIMDEDAKRLERLIADLLVLSRLESKDTNLKLENVSLYDISEQVIERLRPQAEQRRITFVNKIQKDQGTQIFADRDKMHQVFLNLIDNAIKFNREAGNVYLSSKTTDEVVIIEIEDEGMGILEEAIPRLFERFSRVDKARSRELGGTGLGLSIVKHILEIHGGSIACESAYKHWTKFKFILPLPMTKL
jgi:two-component system phosphate regulon sensor histidine kinase PhoR